MNPNPKLSPLSRTLCAAGLLAASLPSLSQTAQPAAPAENRAQSSQEVVITAQKIKQTANKTALAVTAVSGEDLKAAGVQNAIDLADTLPSVWISVDTGKAQISIRGVTNSDMTEKGDGSTAFHIDGAYIGRPEAQLGGFFDIERVEVLRGPQGTLYGRNATAGAINLITNKPERKFGAKLGIDVGNYGALRTDAMINVPLNDMFQFRAAVSTAQHDSYLNPGPNVGIPLQDQKDRAGRLHLLTSFSADTSLLLTVEQQHSGGHGATPVPITNFFDGTPVGNLPFSPAGRGNNLLNPVYVNRGSAAQLTTAWEFGGAWRAGSPLAGQPAEPKQDQDVNAYRGEFKTTLAGIDVNYQLAHMKIDTDGVTLGNFFGFPFRARGLGDSKSTSHELRLSQATGSLRWVAGAYLFDEAINRDTNFYTYVTLPNGFPLTVNLPFLPHIENNSKAVFGQTTWSVLPATRLTAGLRFTRDTKTGDDPLGGTAAAVGATRSTNAYTKAVEFSNTSYRLGVDHDLAANVMVYGAVATGYKSGGFNDNASRPDYKPENLRSLEGGLKGRFLNNSLQLGVSVFDYDYRNLQVGTVDCPDGTPASCGAFQKNAARAKVRGVEVEGWWNVLASGRVNFGLSVLDAKYKDYKVVDRPVNNPTLVVDWSGQRLDKASPVTLNLGYTHNFSLGNGGDVGVTLGTRYTGKYLISTSDENGIRYEQPGFHKSDFNVTYNEPGGKWNVQAYVKNIENYIAIGARVPGSVTVTDPRTYGLRGSYTF